MPVLDIYARSPKWHFFKLVTRRWYLYFVVGNIANSTKNYSFTNLEILNKRDI